MSSGPERVFLGAKHTIAPERIRLGAEMVEITECIKIWVKIREGRLRAVLIGVFRETRDVDKLIEILELSVEDEVVEVSPLKGVSQAS